MVGHGRLAPSGEASVSSQSVVTGLERCWERHHGCLPIPILNIVAETPLLICTTAAGCGRCLTTERVCVGRGERRPREAALSDDVEETATGGDSVPTSKRCSR